MAHIDAGERCLVCHYEGDYRNMVVLPPCIKCANCREWVRPKDMDKPCAKSSPAREKEK
jgi:hypothetical protein